jgi:hypothetical protein
MKLKVNGEYQDVEFWGFFKFWVISWIVAVVGIFMFFFIIGVLT